MVSGQLSLTTGRVSYVDPTVFSVCTLVLVLAGNDLTSTWGYLLACSAACCVHPHAKDVPGLWSFPLAGSKAKKTGNLLVCPG